MFIRAKIAKKVAYYCLVELKRMRGQLKPRQRTKHYLGNYAEAKVVLSSLDISPEQQQTFAARVEELEAVAKRQREPRSRRGQPRKTEKTEAIATSALPYVLAQFGKRERMFSQMEG